MPSRISASLSEAYPSSSPAPSRIACRSGGRLDRDELVSGTFPLADINAAFEALAAGTVTRSVITY